MLRMYPEEYFQNSHDNRLIYMGIIITAIVAIVGIVAVVMKK